jgi:hypothetical protein
VQESAELEAAFARVFAAGLRQTLVIVPTAGFYQLALDTIGAGAFVRMTPAESGFELRLDGMKATTALDWSLALRFGYRF